MSQPFFQYIPKLFPYDVWYLVAPFWTAVDITGEVGSVSYQVYSTGSALLDTVNTIISDEENINFIGHWMIVAEWKSVPSYPHYDSQVSSIISVLFNVLFKTHCVNECTQADRQTNRLTHGPSTVTLVVHARRRLTV